MFDFGGNKLATAPQRFLPEGSVLVYRRDHTNVARDLDVNGVIWIASVMEDRGCRWIFQIMELAGDEFELRIDNDRGWLAFREVPELFSVLAIFASNTGQRRRIRHVVELLEGFGAVEQVQ